MGVTEPQRKDDHDRRQHCETWFWHSGHPLEVKFEIEKVTRILLACDTTQIAQLVYTGSSFSADPGFRAQLRFEAASPERHLYSLHLDATASRKWFSQERLQQEANKAFERWTLNLQTTPALRSLEPFSRELYEQLVTETLAREEELANRKEDEAAIQSVRQAVLDAMRSGKRCTSGNKEGQTAFYFDGKQFVKEHRGDWDERREFAGGDEMLTELRSFYDWDTRRDTYPHRPPELEAWRLIQRQLR